MEFKDRPIAFTDLETTGTEYLSGSGEGIIPWHEICEVGLVVARQSDLKILHTLNEKVKIRFPERMTAKSQEVNGYNETDWRDAKELEEVLIAYNVLASDAIFVSHNATFDWGFLNVAFAKHHITPRLDYHRIDLWTYAKAILDASGYKLDSYRLPDICKFLQISEEPMPHRAINGAMAAYRIYAALNPLMPNQFFPTEEVDTWENEGGHPLSPS